MVTTATGVGKLDIIVCKQNSCPLVGKMDVHAKVLGSFSDVAAQIAPDVMR